MKLAQQATVRSVLEHARKGRRGRPKSCGDLANSKTGPEDGVKTLVILEMLSHISVLKPALILALVSFINFLKLTTSPDVQILCPHR